MSGLAGRYAQQAYSRLNGVFCIYKPPQLGMEYTISKIQDALKDDLNNMPLGPPRKLLHFNEHTSSVNGECGVPAVTAYADPSQNKLVTGDAYWKEDFNTDIVRPRLPKFASGLVLCGIGKGQEILKHIANARMVQVYHVTGELGAGYDDFTKYGRLRERSSCLHVTRAKFDRVIAATQSGHTKHMFMTAGVDIQSQEAYEIASRGLLRPLQSQTGPVIYSMKLIDFKKPTFTLEVHSINCHIRYIAKLVHNMGLSMKTNACVTALRKLRHGQIDLNHALVQRQWNATEIINNIEALRGYFSRDQLQYKLEVKHTEKLEFQKRPLLEEGAQKTDLVQDGTQTRQARQIEGGVPTR